MPDRRKPRAEAPPKYADTAMYRAKQAGRDTFRFFAAQMNADVLARLEPRPRWFFDHRVPGAVTRTPCEPRLDVGRPVKAGALYQCLRGFSMTGVQARDCRWPPDRVSVPRVPGRAGGASRID